ncbi:MAG: thioredoxin family protein [Holophagaceae bacterium]
MLIEVFGPGCLKCQTMEKHAKEAVEKSGGSHEVVKISDYAAMVSRGVLSTPALAVEGQLKFQGRVASTDEILELIKA